MAGGFEDKTVVVTGGTGALGAAVVGALLERGARCAVPCYDEAELDGWPHAGDDRVRVETGVDLTDEAQTQQFFGWIQTLWASVHVAGGFTMAPIAETSLAEHQKMLAMNATTCFLCCREAVERIRASGEGGRIVNVAAKPALHPVGGMTAYAASKAAVAAITLGLAEELKDERIWVNAVVPSIMDTPANRAAMPDADHGAWPSVVDVAETIVFLSSPANRATRGALTPVYGRS